MGTVKNVMKTDIVSIGPDETLHHAYILMKECGIRHLPVVDATKLVGLISEGDILLHATLEYNQVSVPDCKVSDVMTTEILTCEPDTRLSEVASTLLTCKVDCLPVLRHGRLVGMVTASDFIELVLDSEQMLEGPVLPLSFERRGHSTRRPVYP